MARRDTSTTSPGTGQVAEFFAGIGLMRMGLERAGWHVAWANDNAEFKRRLYQHHFGSSSHFDARSIEEIDGQEVPDVELATASFPCTDLSLAGGFRGLSGKSSSLVHHFFRIIREMEGRRPPMVLLENVPSLLSSGRGGDLAICLRALNQLGYEVEVVIADASWFVPQSRRRMFILGWQSGAAPPRAARLSHPARPTQLLAFIDEHRTIAWRHIALHEAPSRMSTIGDVLENLNKDDSRWWNEKRLSKLRSQLWPHHQRWVEAANGPGVQYATAFRRIRDFKTRAELRVDGVAGCLRTPRGGSAIQILIEASRRGMRARWLTPTECARLMGAESFRIDPGASKTHALFGFGDAVCVPCVEWVAGHLQRGAVTYEPAIAIADV